MSCYPLFEAKAHLTSLVREVEAGPAVELSRHGKTVAVLMGAEQFLALTAKTPSFSSALSRFRAEASAELLSPDDGVFAGLRTQDAGRTVEW